MEAVRPDERLDQAFELLDIRFAAAAHTDPAKDFDGALRSPVTGGATSTRFVFAKAEEEGTEVDNTCLLVEVDDASGAKEHAPLAVGVESEREVGFAGGEHA